MRSARPAGEEAPGSRRAFQLRSAVLFAGTVAGVLLLSAAVNDAFGGAGVALSAALAGFADTHSAAASIAALSASGEIRPSESSLPVLLAFTTNTITKGVFAFTTGGRNFAAWVWAGLGLVLAGAWTGWAVSLAV
jgi:uncharacterized membrane protein (DUF4010 family)